MLIVVDKKLPIQAKQKLQKFGEVYQFTTSGIVDDAISGHPDLFICQVGGKLIVNPQVPASLIELLEEHQINFSFGKTVINESYPVCSAYNAVITEKYLIHRLSITDTTILEFAKGLNRIHVKQGFTRCSLLPLSNDFITSDEGIYKVIKSKNLNVLLVKPEGILLPSYRNGLFGGCCGVYKNKVFIAGKLDKYNNGNVVDIFLESLGYEIVELYDGPLYDGGSILFLS